MSKSASLAASALLVGTPNVSLGSCEIDRVLKQTIENSVDHLIDWMAHGQGSIDHPALSGRRLLESATVALLARIDPLRALYVWRAQNEGKYELDRRNKIAVQWAGDIFPSSGRDKHNDDIDGQVDPLKVDRCLFGKAQNAIVWTPAFQVLLDEWSGASGQNAWQVDALKLSATVSLQQCTKPISAAYSTLSKAIHFESLIPQQLIHPDDVKLCVGNSMKALAACGAALEILISNKSRWKVESINDQHSELEAAFGKFSS
jgi:hypothetical protein